MTAIVTINNVSHRFGSLWAVRDVSFSVERGELLEELFLSEFPRWETAFALIVSVDEIFHVDAPFAPLEIGLYRVGTRQGV